jgi:hypothetical protein
MRDCAGSGEFPTTLAHRSCCRCPGQGPMVYTPPMLETLRDAPRWHRESLSRCCGLDHCLAIGLEQGLLDSVCGLESASEFLIKEEAPYEV